ncbi:SDR family oxidoreductase [Macrococcoides caseolyticum]|uniref:SDR family oxidoreductase n=1 Tax=Macrococcoides caseolyticum TaxID=69966 RepID=UPI00105D2A6C|nr:SDR family oxidoreductase [Macrococcus caseolyticus]TDM28772.1 SDR family oxidoreductase [Macrococcus caseolyticus]VUC64604.1 3-hydroxybutyrate dehydrogenase [Macrococcus caseolyticus]
MDNIIVFGSNGYIGSRFIQQTQSSKIIGIDISHNSLNECSCNVKTFNFDISEVSNYKILTNYLDEENIMIDKVLFSHGSNNFANFFTSEINEFENSIRINLIGVYIALKILYPYLKDNSSILVIASQNGVVGHEDRIDYGTAKAGLIHLVKNLTLDFAKYSDKDIKINALSPGYILNDSNKEFFKTYKGKKLISKNPYGKIVSIDEVIYSINFLLSEASHSIRGQNIIIDYGYTIQ